MQSNIALPQGPAEAFCFLRGRVQNMMTEGHLVQQPFKLLYLTEVSVNSRQAQVSVFYKPIMPLKLQ